MCIDSPSHHRKGVKIHCQDVYDRIHLFTNVGLCGNTRDMAYRKTPHN